MCSHARNSVSCPEHAPCTCVQCAAAGGDRENRAESPAKDDLGNSGRFNELG